METSTTTRPSAVLYRYRTGETLSAWMRSDELRVHAAEGRIKPDSSIQQVGREQWVPAAKVPGLWNAPGGQSEGSAPQVVATMTAAHGGAESAGRTPERPTPGDGSGAGAGGSTGAHAGGATHTGSGAHAAGTTHPHRLGESVQHLLQRALLGHVTVSSPQLRAPVRATLVGVTNDAIALEFEACGTVVFVPWARVRSVTLPSTQAHSPGRIRAHAELLLLEVEHLPASVEQAA